MQFSCAQGQGEQTSVGKDRFLFLGNQLMRDFLDTRPVSNQRKLELLPDFKALLRWFKAAGLVDKKDGLWSRLCFEASRSEDVFASLACRESGRRNVSRWQVQSVTFLCLRASENLPVAICGGKAYKLFHAT